MRGILYNNKNGWIVKYFSPPTVNHFGWINSDSKFEELPLHENSITESLIDSSKVEFEIVESGLLLYAKLCSEQK